MAVVTSKNAESLILYAEPNLSNKNNIVGSIRNGTYFSADETRVIQSVTWARFSCPGFTNVWVIVKHPSANYDYVDLYAEVGGGSDTASIYNGTVKPRGLSTSNTPSSTSYTKASLVSESFKGGVVKGVSNTMPTSEISRSVNLSNNVPGSRNSSRESEYSMPPSIIQNDRGYPKVLGVENSGRYSYDYATDYSDPTLIENMNKVRASVNLSLDNPGTIFQWNTGRYNRFKITNPNEILDKTFSHVFFTRPDCSILNYKGSGSIELHQNVSGSALHNLRFSNAKELLCSLVTNCGYDNEFMLYLSNKVVGFELKDRNLETDTYGKTLRGNSIAYGKNAEKSKAAGEVSITFSEDYLLHTLQLHELWIDYIDGISVGRYTPDNFYVMNKILDYAASAYYFVCGSDGETILYFAKLYGIFPTNVPDSILNYQKGNLVSNPELSITYQYSWIVPNDPRIIMDFNTNSGNSNYKYEKTYQADILGTGTTWVGAPFVEMSSNDEDHTMYKLRFRPL